MIFMNFFRENDFMENSFCETLDAWNFVEKHDSAIFFWRKLAKKLDFFLACVFIGHSFDDVVRDSLRQVYARSFFTNGKRILKSPFRKL